MTTASSPKVIQVFEHGTLRIGQRFGGITFTKKHLESLKTYALKKGHKYYTLSYNGVKFSHYVGALQIGDLTIEILPKIDENAIVGKDLHQRFLLDMMRVCSKIKVESLTEANLRLKSNSVLEIYFHLFLSEVEKILQEGLIKSYHREEGQVKVLKGRILFAKHLKTNLIHKEQIYSNYQDYNYSNLLNSILVQSLQAMKRLQLSPGILGRTNQILRDFPKVDFRRIQTSDFESIRYDQKTFRYKKAVEIAQLILGNFSPDIRFGQYNLVAILFDMNRLFEEYVYRQMLKYCGKHIQLFRQSSKPFWQDRKIRPDLVLKIGAKTFILDTKWKIIQNTQPSIGDLKQMFVYSQYFDATKSILIYPSAENQEDSPPIPYLPNSSGHLSYCQTIFLPLIHQGILNQEIGAQILEKITQQ